MFNRPDEWLEQYVSAYLSQQPVELRIERLLQALSSGTIDALFEDRLISTRELIWREGFRDSLHLFSEHERTLVSTKTPTILQRLVATCINEPVERARAEGKTAHICPCGPTEPPRRSRMAQVQVTYDGRRNWGRIGHQQDYRPYEEIILHGRSGYKRIWCLVDSGADDLQVEQSFAHNIGINLRTQGNVEQVQTAGGSLIQVTRVIDLDVEIEGVKVKVDCLFGSNSTPILGRNAFLAVLEVGFDVSGWLLKR